MDNWLSVKQDLEAKGYVEETKDMSILAANVIGFFIALLIMGLAIKVFEWFTVDLFKNINFPREGLAWVYIVLFVLTIIIFAIVHELVHGATWARYCKEGTKSIEYGFIKKFLSPYCHCNEVLEVKQYRRGVIMPFLVVGLLPYIISIATGSVFLMFVSICMMAGSAGDLLILFLLAPEKKGTLVYDHPTNCGSIVYRKAESTKQQ